MTGSSVGELSRFLDVLWINFDCARETVKEVLINRGYFGNLIRNLKKKMPSYVCSGDVLWVYMCHMHIQ